MAKRTPSMITGETARKIKQMSVPELNTYLYAIYRAGYADGFRDAPDMAAKVAAIAETITAETAPKEGEPGAG